MAHVGGVQVIEERIKKNRFVQKMAQSSTDLQESVVPIMDGDDAAAVDAGMGAVGAALT